MILKHFQKQIEKNLKIIIVNLFHVLNLLNNKFKFKFPTATRISAGIFHL